MELEESSERTDVPRMWIDLNPPDAPEYGDVWIRMGVVHVWKCNEDGRRGYWLPTWPQGYPRPGKKKKKVKEEADGSPTS